MSLEKRKTSCIAGLIIIALSLVIALLLVLNRQYVVDQLSVLQYKPEVDVQVLAERSGMNDTGKFYFYASRPTLEDARTFSAKCGKSEASTAILGCYSAQRIYIYNVTDERLYGIKSVTAAHEMLHAAYERLGSGEKQRVDALLDAEYQKLKDDGDLTKRMEFYHRTEPGQQDNELHSVLGAEIKQLSPELEEYFSRYFAERGKVTALHDQYSAVFERLQERAEQISTELHALASRIEEGTASYNTDVEQLNQTIATFNDKAENGGFDSQAHFERERQALLAVVDELEATRTALNNDIKRYEVLREELAGIATQSDELNRSINSSLAPAPSL